MKFFVGLHQPSDAGKFERCCISINRIRNRKSPFQVGKWIMDSGAFTELSTYGRYRNEPSVYAEEAGRWTGNGRLAAIVSQDYMCEPWIVARTGLSVREHQRLTIERYDELAEAGLSVPILPVLQGYDPSDYVRHIDDYGARLGPGAWVGVGSVCKRNGNPMDVAHVLARIKAKRPDIRLHGFGLKLTAILNETVRALLYSADSMAWSFAARRAGRNANDWREAKAFETRVSEAATKPKLYWQDSLPLEAP